MEQFEFGGTVIHDATVEEGYMSHLVVLPDEIAQVMTRAGVVRVVGELVPMDRDPVATPFRRALQKWSGDGLCLRFGMGWLRDAGIQVGEPLAIWVSADPNPDSVDVPFELERALRLDLEVARYWGSLTPGRQRTLAYGIERIKRPETRARNAESMVADLRVEMEGGPRIGPKRR